MNSSKERLILFVVFITSAAIYGLSIDTFQVGTYHDDAHYVVLAESLASGRGYWLTNGPVPQMERFFPPGYPLLLGGLVWLFPQNLNVLKVLSAAFCLGSVALVYALLKVKHFRSHDIFIIAGLTALHPTLAGTSGMVMSEPAYLFLSMLSLHFMEQWLEGKVSLRRHISLGFVLALTTLTRTPGILLLIVALARQFYRKRFVSGIIILIGFLIAYSPYIIFNLQHGGGLFSTGYQEQLEGGGSLGTKVASMGENLGAYVNDVLPHYILPLFGPRLTTLVSDTGLLSVLFVIKGFLLLMIFVGFFKSIKRFPLINAYVAFYSLALLQVNYPWVDNVQARYIIPISPFVMLYLLAGIKLVLNALSRFLTRNTHFTYTATRLIAAVLLLLYLGRGVQGVLDPVRNRITDISIGSEWFGSNASTGAVIMCRDPVSRYLYIRRPTVGYPTTKDAGRILEYIDFNKVDYILIAPKLQTPRTIELDEYTEEYLLPAVLALPNRFVRVYENDQNNVTVYRVAGSIR